MKGGKSILLPVLLFLVVVVGAYGITSYNSLVKKHEEINNKFADVESQIQRRADLIPNLVNTVKGYMTHEEEVIKSVTDARAALMIAKTDSEILEANDNLNSALARLLVITENYPDLKANENFKALQDELAGTENRINTARMDYNKAVKDYNSDVKTFPKSLIAKTFGFEEKEYFEAKEEAHEVPDVSFE